MFKPHDRVPEYLCGHEGAFRLVQPLELRRLFDLIKFGVCRRYLSRTSKTVYYVMVARLKPDHKPWRISKARGWLACEDPGGQDWETYFEEGGEQCLDQNEYLQWARQALDIQWEGSLRLKGAHAAVLTGNVDFDSRRATYSFFSDCPVQATPRHHRLKLRDTHRLSTSLIVTTTTKPKS